MRILCEEACDTLHTSTGSSKWPVLTGILVVLMPKCAFCWAAYTSILSTMGIVIQYRPWFVPVAVVLFLVTLVKLFIIAVRRKKYVSLMLAIAAGMIILLQRSVPGMNGWKIVGVGLMSVAVVIDKIRLSGLWK